MRIGLSTPIVVEVPGIALPWETGAGVEDLIQIASTTDELGYAFLTCSEHIAVPRADAPARGDVYWDPLATLSYSPRTLAGSGSPRQSWCSVTTTLCG